MRQQQRRVRMTTKAARWDAYRRGAYMRTSGGQVGSGRGLPLTDAGGTEGQRGPCNLFVFCDLVPRVPYS